MKEIKTGIPDAISVQEELCEHYKAKIHPGLSDKQIEKIKIRIHLLKLTIEALKRLNPELHAIDGKCPECGRKFSEFEIKNFFYCPDCGKGLINPEAHADIARDV